MKPALLLALFVSTSLLAQTAAPKAPAPAPAAKPKGPTIPADAQWHDVTTWGVEGRGWGDQERLRWFDRLPAKAEKTVTPAVWGLSRDSAGMMVRFKTDAKAIYCRYDLFKANLAMPAMPATGVSGLDLYARDAKGQWKWVTCTKPGAQHIEAVMISDLAPGEHEFAAYLPLYNGIEKLEIGVPANAKFEGLKPREKPVVFYGTSITHGANASRPGMVHTAILGRHLDRPVINLGFSGNGRMDAAVGDLLNELDPAVIVIDCLPNMGPADVAAKCVPLVKQLRSKHTTIPIILVEDRRFTNSWITPAKAKFHDENHAALKAAYEQLKKEKVANLHYIGGDALYGTDAEGSNDASHGTDLGFLRQAEIFEPVLRKALK
ncbi:SGNH/GDSL hydrolase family protein [Prosthecobacter sp.]|uniref:SGNH/GDSL hydrolase family protein n=1 Tax=Prosthecobacter sp. TaxID=1965333 RepID=UPI0037830423